MSGFSEHDVANMADYDHNVEIMQSAGGRQHMLVATNEFRAKAAKK